MDISPLARRRALQLGPAGEAWLADLDDVVAHLEQRWSLEATTALTDGSAACVVRARTARGEDVVLKIDPPDPRLTTTAQLRTLEAARGRGYVRLLAHDVESRAMLLEGLGTPLTESGLEPEQQMEVLCTTLAQVWQSPLPDAATDEQAREKAVSLADLVGTLWADLGRPCSEPVVALALEYAQRRGAGTDLASAVVVHGDPHPGNLLQVPVPRRGAESGYVFIDPDGILADPAYDVGVVLRGWPDQLLAGSADDTVTTARRYAALLASCSGLDETAIWEWGFLERVSSGLYLKQLGAHEIGDKYLRVAELLLATEP